MVKRKTSNVAPSMLETYADIIRSCVKSIQNGTQEQFEQAWGSDPLTSLNNIANMLDAHANPEKPMPHLVPERAEVEDPALDYRIHIQIERCGPEFAEQIIKAGQFLDKKVVITSIKEENIVMRMGIRGTIVGFTSPDTLDALSLIAEDGTPLMVWPEEIELAEAE